MWILSRHERKLTLTQSPSQLESLVVQLQNLSQRLLKVQDEERRRVARDLHDSTGQTLTAPPRRMAKFGEVVDGQPFLYGVSWNPNKKATPAAIHREATRD